MSPRPTLTRRRALLVALCLPVAAACSPGYSEEPDVLVPLLERARADAAAAEALGTEAAKQVAQARAAQATALQAEVDRLNRPRQEGQQAPPGRVPDVTALAQRLVEARQQAEQLVATLPRHRAGLVGSVAAGSAALLQLFPEQRGKLDSGELDAPATGALEPDTVQAVQGALAAEHGAVWVYGLVTAFLPGDYRTGMTEGAAVHRDRRDACERVLAAAGATPQPAEPAYLPPKPVTDAASAMALVATAESDAAAAWRGVLERTDDAQLRGLALTALVGSATRGTRWREAAGEKPAAPALPGAPA
ncbi:ferritin-like domain-containing protein [Amycolatopsis suaedae]|uniref:DUF4439 domain-containing protein n=1 Tax=Amycolatopsis suaedae TaxID=2510978 RepID=A0A4Q7J070_9PSEU|nr:ferritin-like domain-containing protein [Amycolatopsis suaedae]RZQ59766.1 DUF4439 domain-containing protein [Amycolatopsis suaedae]